MKSADKLSAKLFNVTIWVLVILTPAFLLLAVTHGMTNLAWKEEAVEQGHAEWYMDGHTREWRWKAPSSGNAPNE